MGPAGEFETLMSDQRREGWRLHNLLAEMDLAESSPGELFNIEWILDRSSDAGERK